MNTNGSNDGFEARSVAELRSFVSGRIVERMLASTGKNELLEISAESSEQAVQRSLRESRVAGFRPGAAGFG